MTHIPTPAKDPASFVEDCGLRSAGEWAEQPIARMPDGSLKRRCRVEYIDWIERIIRTTLLAAAKADCSYCRDDIPWVKSRGRIRMPLSHQYRGAHPPCKARGVWRLIGLLNGERKCTG